MQWAALLRGTPGRQAGLLYWLYGSADQPANLEVSEPDSSFTLRQHLLTPEQVAAARARPARPTAPAHAVHSASKALLGCSARVAKENSAHKETSALGCSTLSMVCSSSLPNTSPPPS